VSSLKCKKIKKSFFKFLLVMIELLWYLNCMKVDKETIKRVLARNADKWNKRYAQINRLEKIKKVKKGVAIF